MKLFRRIILIGALLVLAATPPVYAQATLNQTTLASAVTGGAGVSASPVVTVASASNITVGDVIYVPTTREAMLVNAISGTQLTVRRGYDGTAAMPAAAAAIVYTGAQTRWTSVDPTGTCTPSGQIVLPLINTRSGTVWNCAATTTGYQWVAWNAVPATVTAPRTVVAGTTLATSSYTILPTDYVVVLGSSGTGTTSTAVNVKSFTLPSHVGLAGKQIIIKDESGGLTATTNIVMVGTIDGTNSLITNVVQLKTPFQSVGVQAGSGGWFTLWCFPGASVGISCR
jgi:hypothetical protein